MSLIPIHKQLISLFAELNHIKTQSSKDITHC